ncbi:hypothetical protein BKA70DRAFT_1433348 [Coprinopsis sp. MPI-PUGE-AT-0042]|nr:hypothetical protein BKA70DRAFT_1433348 [Coprinopsis sp. MPI-PUGE-AT-0042]
MSQVGGGVSTRSSARKAAVARAESPSSPSAGLQRSIANAQHSLATSSASSHTRRTSPMPPFPDLHLPPLPQPTFSAMHGLPKPASLNISDKEDFFGRSVSSSPPSRPPMTTVIIGPPQAHAPGGYMSTEYALTGHPPFSANGGGVNSAAFLPPRDAPVVQRKASPTAGSVGRSLTPIPVGGDAPLIPSFFPLLTTRIPKGFNTVAAQTPAHDEVVGSRCDFSFDGEEEDFDASPSRQRAGRIPNDHKEILDGGIREIDEIFLRMHKETGRTVTNLQNHYLASKGLKRTARSIWNQYQRYFAANRVQERAACGDENAECKDAFLHFQTRFTNWREILSQVDEIITQEEACASGYRRRTAFNQAVQKLKALVRINHQTHGFQTFAVIMGNQPNMDQNLFSIIESPGAQGFMGEKEEDRACAMYTSDFIGSFRAHVNTLANKAHVANFRSQQEAGVSGGPSSQPQLAGLLTSSPTRKEVQAVDKQTKLAVPTGKPAKARKLVGVNISASAFPWKQLDKTLVSQGGIILNYPDNVPFPNVSPNPTYVGPACKPESRNGTGIRTIGIPTMRRLANCCHDGEDGIRFVGGYSRKLIEDSLVPWIVGPIPGDATSPVRCLYYDGSARRVPRQSLPAEWLSTVKKESPSTPRASREPVTPRHSSSPTRSRSSTPTPRGAKEVSPLSLPPPKTISSQTPSPPFNRQAARLPSPTPQPAKEPIRLPTPLPPPENQPKRSAGSIPPFANLHSHPRARVVRRATCARNGWQAIGNLAHPTFESHNNPRFVIQTGIRVLEDSTSNTPSSKRLKSLSPNSSQSEDSGAGSLPPPALNPSSDYPHPHNPSSPQEAGSSLPALTPTSNQQGPVSSSRPSGQDIIKQHEGLDTLTTPVNNPSIPPEVAQAMPDRSGLQAPPSMHPGSYAPPSWQSGYGGYPHYGHLPYYPPPPRWGYPDAHPNYYQPEPQ